MKKLCTFVAALLLLPGSASAFDDQWYLGLGGGVAFLSPEPEASGFDSLLSENAAVKVYIGRDISRESSVQLEYSNFGEAPIVTGQMVTYQAAEGAIIYRIFDTRDRALTPGNLSFRLYGRFGLGFLQRDVEQNIALENASNVYFSPGFGAELLFNRWAGLRAEGSYLDLDVWQANIGVVFRFGGTGATARPSTPPPSTPVFDTSTDEAGAGSIESSTPAGDGNSATTLPAESGNQSQGAAEPQRTTVADLDNDGVPDNLDQCNDSRSGYPVQENGCSLLNGVLSGVRFAPGTADLMPSSFAQLNYLAGLLMEYPEAGIRLLAHTDTNRSARDQAILTRARLRTLGTYLVRRGVSANRLVLRSFGGSKPVAANDTAAGRAANNRIEVLER